MPPPRIVTPTSLTLGAAYLRQQPLIYFMDYVEICILLGSSHTMCPLRIIRLFKTFYFIHSFDSVHFYTIPDLRNFNCLYQNCMTYQHVLIYTGSYNCLSPRLVTSLFDVFFYVNENGRFHMIPNPGELNLLRNGSE